MCYLLVAWLTLHAGVSRSTANVVLQALSLILGMVTQFFVLLLKSLGHAVSNSAEPTLLLDVRSVYKNINVDPEIIRFACCPKCFSLYRLSSVPKVCGWRQSPRSKVCNEKLTKSRRTHSGPKNVPRCLYNMQSFESWLRFFLMRPGIEDLLDKSIVQSTTYVPGQNTKMCGIWDSPAWRSFGNYTFTRYNLIFGLYIDWFNPLTNKIAGKLNLFKCVYIIADQY